MKLFFEECQYDISVLREHISSRYYIETDPDKVGSINYVGYYFNYKAENPEDSDSVFIIPKVFLDEKGRPFGLDVDPKELVDWEGAWKRGIIDSSLKDFMYGFTVWIYQAINNYHNRLTSNSITEHSIIQNVICNKGESSTSFLDIVLQLIQFQKNNRNLFTFISKVNRAGNKSIDWNRTINSIQPLIRNKKPYYCGTYRKLKTINYDEDIIVLFLSVLKHIEKEYNKKIQIDGNYKLIPEGKIETLIETGKGTRYLKSIRRKYFHDRLVALWKILYVYFEKSENILSGKYHPEVLLAKDFDRVFEDMVDVLIGDENIPYGLKKQKDGKEIDHIYADDSLFPTDPRLIYFIGDSKYYKPELKVDGKSIYKQFTYAKNVIQYNIDYLLNEGAPSDFFYRDELTEGYNVTPNFFIRGAVDNKDRNYNYSDPNLQASSQTVKPNKHWNDRLFDRDTLIVNCYDINFLYVLSTYAMHGSASYKQSIRKRFRKDIIDTLNSKYVFFKIYPNISQEDFVEKHFRRLLGKIFKSDPNNDFIWLAFERDSNTMQADIDAIKADCDKYEEVKLNIK